jgi:hypothetical protein
MKGLISHLTIAAVAAAALTAVPAARALQYPQYQQQRGYHDDQQRDWQEGMPPHLQEVMQEGFREGVRGAHKDAENHRSWNVNNRDEYRHPNYEGLEREAYRCSFRLGYRFAVERMTGQRWGDDDDRR